VIDHLEAGRPAGIVDGGHVHQDVELKLGVGSEKSGDRCDPLGAKHDGLVAVLVMGVEKAVGEPGAENLGGATHAQYSCLCFWIFSCSIMMPWMTVSGRGGHPGM